MERFLENNEPVQSPEDVIRRIKSTFPFLEDKENRVIYRTFKNLEPSYCDVIIDHSLLTVFAYSPLNKEYWFWNVVGDRIQDINKGFKDDPMPDMKVTSHSDAYRICEFKIATLMHFPQKDMGDD